jgi:hypothetical protein
MRTSKAFRTSVCALLALVAVLAVAASADAGSRQLSLIQDDAEMFGEREDEDPAVAIREMRDLGVDVLRTNVLFYRIYRRQQDRVKPAGFDTSDPNEPLYDWFKTDRIVHLARTNGIKLMLTISGPGPKWFSERPSRCRSSKPCTYRPKASEFGQFAAAVAKRYRGLVDWYSIYNEPNLKEWITPEATNTRSGRVETAAVYYRKLWIEGYKAIRAYDPARRGRVLFGEVAAISAPLPFLYASLCLDPAGKPFRGKLRALHNCGAAPAKLNVGGWAIHPYNQGGLGPPRRRTDSKTALPQQYMPRLHRLMSRSAARRRVPGGRGIYVTEFGYQTRPPDPVSWTSPSEQAQYINESDRLFFGDSRIKTVAQYQLVDVPIANQYNSGLRFAGGRKKPSYDAYRLPIMVTRRSSRLVEVWGQVRPARFARTLGGFVNPEVQFTLGGAWKTVVRPSPSSVGIFRLNQRRAGAASGRWRIKWTNTINGGVSYSRVAKAVAPFRYYRD